MKGVILEYYTIITTLNIIFYRKESAELEKLNLFSWEDDTITNKVFFEIQNQNKEICCQTSIQIHNMFRNRNYHSFSNLYAGIFHNHQDEQ
jgi:hypothetical protein